MYVNTNVHTINYINLIVDGWMTSGTDITDIHLNDFLDIYRLNKYRDQSRYSYEYEADAYRYFETVLSENTRLYTDDGDENSYVTTITAGTEIVLLARNNSRDNRYYLIKLKNDTNLWSGWIKISAVSQSLNEEISNTRYGERFLMTLHENVSTRGDLFTTHIYGSEPGEFVVVRKNGEIIFRLQNPEIMKIFPSAITGYIIGWSTDQTKIWFVGNEMAIVDCFGIIDMNTLKYILLECPPSYGSSSFAQKATNFDTGEMYYTDFHYQFDVIGAQMTKESGEIFHLYFYNFITKEQREIDTNIGEGFQISYDRTNGFKYEKDNHSW
ncbi:MAG: hypothetical protein LBI28_04400 [Treponema sp.]|nr:hypothetical protein [Treponema sp.]